jgi:AbrB family looped-hinge helix DNA binding protein
VVGGTTVSFLDRVVGVGDSNVGECSSEPNHGEEFTLKVDERGRVTLPKEVRERLGVESDDEIPAIIVGSVLALNLKTNSKLETATAGRDEWENTTPTGAGETLFGFD